ncbi:MAG: hypothetical protein ACFCBV_13755 [Phycisphaerales bacterium]
MQDTSNQRRVPPVFFIGGVLGVVIVAVAAVAVFEALSNAPEERVPAPGQPDSVVSRTSVADAASANVRDQLAQSAEHQNLGLEAMSPLYSPAVVDVSLVSEDGTAKKTAGFFIGPGRVAVPRSAVVGAVRGSVLLDIGKTFEVQRIVAEAPEVDLALLTIELPSELLRGFQVAFLEPLPGESLLMIGTAEAPGEEDTPHPTLITTVKRVRIGEDMVNIMVEEDLPAWSLGAPLRNETGKLGGYVARVEDGALAVFGAERFLRLDPLPGLTLAEWTGGATVESTRPPPETEDLWAEIRALPRPDGFEPAPTEFRGFDVRPARIEMQDGRLLLDERFSVRGSGTTADPYVLPWSLLMSASETFNPSRGKLVLPERVTMFEGTWVRFEGNFAIPFAERFVRELLVMQHPWDGCCLGVPPTPYDAIEVALAVPLEPRPQFGFVTGKLKVDPFVRGKWLYGMYLMESTRMALEDESSEDN